MEKEKELTKQIQTLKKLREDIGMNRTEFSRYIEIPLRTLEEWEAGRRKMPEYVLRLITYYANTQMMLKEKQIILEENDSEEE